jgi:hypothetical protein
MIQQGSKNVLSGAREERNKSKAICQKEKEKRNKPFSHGLALEFLEAINPAAKSCWEQRDVGNRRLRWT